jgi:hypothetical protein
MCFIFKLSCHFLLKYVRNESKTYSSSMLLLFLHVFENKT